MSQDEADLCRLLATAAERLAAVTGPVWSRYDSGPALAEFVLRCRSEIADGTIGPADRRELWTVFAPTCDWDDVVGDVALGNEVFDLLDRLYGAEVRRHPADGAPLRVAVSGPEAGWLDLSLAATGGEFPVRVSCTPNDFVADLLAALSLAMRNGVGRATANAEPTSYEFVVRPVPQSDGLELRVTEHSGRGSLAGRVAFSAEGTREQVVRPFAEALRAVEGRVGPDGYRAAMRQEFPSAKLRSLLDLLGDVRAAGGG